MEIERQNNIPPPSELQYSSLRLTPYHLTLKVFGRRPTLRGFYVWVGQRPTPATP